MRVTLRYFMRLSAPDFMVADKLVEVCLRDVGTQWLLIHIEIQAQRDGSLAERIFDFNYRIFKEFGRPVASLVVLAGLEEGMRKGLEQGRKEGALVLLERLLERRFGPLPKTVRDKLDRASLQQLEAWSDALPEAQSLRQVFQ